MLHVVTLIASGGEEMPTTSYDAS